MTDIGRLVTAMVTPFDGEGKVDYDQAKRLAGALLESGSDDLVVVGTTGESPALSQDEQYRMFVEVVGAIEGRASVIAGAGSNNTHEAIEYTKDAQRAGAQAALHVVPYYNKPTQEGLFRHFKSIAENTSLPVILYNVPSRTITNLSAETTLRLSEIDNIVGIKEASADFEQIATIIEGAPEGFKVWSGNDADTFHLMCMGGYGVVSVASHLVGLQIRAMMKMLMDGSLNGAAAEHLRLLPIFKGLFVVSNPIPVKFATNLVGFNVGAPRLPLVEPDENIAGFLRDLINQYQIDLPV
ncbi:MAG: 4-hydroxy-tetrahydrodipicolinate synthase [Chloroflexi bacterium]|jgi:4-hydroxy-tetrahydrodipicolinate synthase|nr:MAG: 4-hydroxy-tetrahydrodipicolinate synthase [Chloroflexota bacterium]